MTQKICIECELPIAEGEKTAIGTDGEMHYRCFKRGSSVGRPAKMERCSNCGHSKVVGMTCFQCGVGPRIGGE